MVLGWVEETRPRVFILTDGSGRGGASRIGSSENVLRAAKAEAGSVWGAMTDQAFYQAVLDGKTALFVDLAVRLGRELAEMKAPYVAGDAREGFNPTHDVCRMIIDAAARRAGRDGASIENYAFLLFSPHQKAPREGAIYRTLSETELERKLAAGRAYPELAAEAEAAFSGTSRNILGDHQDLAAIVDASMEGIGEASFGVECLVPAAGLPRVNAERPFYEIYGERLVASGKYQRAIRYREHVQPIERALAAL
jgi:hypothetical protein